MSHGHDCICTLCILQREVREHAANLAAVIVEKEEDKDRMRARISELETESRVVQEANKRLAAQVADLTRELEEMREERDRARMERGWAEADRTKADDVAKARALGDVIDEVRSDLLQQVADLTRELDAARTVVVAADNTPALPGPLDHALVAYYKVLAKLKDGDA